MTQTNEMNTLSEVLNALIAKNIYLEYRWTPTGFQIQGNEKTYQPFELVIIKTYRFEGNSSPSDMSILYLIKSNDGQIGYSIDAYGTYCNHEDGYYTFIRHVPVLRNY